MQRVSRALITGVSSGLGLGLARALVQDGWTVYGCSRREPEDLAQEAAESSTGTFHFRAIDLSALDAIPAELRTLLNGETKLDLVILNAGLLGRVADVQETPLAEMREVLNLNLLANKVLMDALLDDGLQIEQVVAISSGASVSGNRGWSSYGISKAALNMLVQLYAAETPQIHWTSLAPGLIDSEMQDYVYNEVDTRKFPDMQRLKEARGTEKMPGPDEAARRILPVLPRLRELPSGSFQDVRKI